MSVVMRKEREAFEVINVPADTTTQIVDEINRERAEEAAMLPNSGSLEAFWQEAYDLGSLSGRGKDAQIRFAMRCFELAFFGKLTVEHAQQAAEQYVTGGKANAQFDAKANSAQKLTSWVRKWIEAGHVSFGGAPDEPLLSANKVFNAWHEARQDENTKDRTVDANAAFLTFCRQLIANKVIPSDLEIRLYCLKHAPKPKTERGALQKMVKLAKQMGETDKIYDNIVQACQRRLKQIERGKPIVGRQRKSKVNGSVPEPSFTSTPLEVDG